MSRSNDIAGLTTSILDGVTAAEVGLGNVTNESKATMFTSPTFTGTTDVSSGVTLPSNPTIVLGSNATFPPGHVIQTIKRDKADEDTPLHTGTSYTECVDASGNKEWYGTITPASGNKVLINFNFVAYLEQGDADDGASFCIFRDSTIIRKHNNRHAFYFGAVATNHNVYSYIHLNFLDDSPGGDGSTAITYYLGYCVYGNCGIRVQSGTGGQPFQSLLQEIKG